MSEYEERTPRFQFSGEPEDYDTFGLKYVARASIKRFDGVITGEVTLRTKPEMDAETDAAKIKEDEEISEMNIKAFSDLMISMNTDTAEGKVAFNLVAGSRDKVNYPKGNAKEAWDKLKDEYEPKTITSYIKMKSKLNKCHLEKFANPASWITELSKICVRLEEMKHPVSEEDQFIHIIGSLPLKYRQEQKDFEKMMKANTLTIKYIKEELNSAHEDFANATEGDDDDEDKEDKDVALVTGQFKGNCNNCGKYGHKKLTCPELTQATRQGGERNQNNGGKNRYNGGGRGAFLGTCFHCGIRGHKKHECRRNPENRNNGTTGNNGNNNNSNNNDDDDDDVAEVMLVATETLIAPAEPTQKKNVWFEWNEECEESDCEDEGVDDEVIVHTIVEDPNDKVHEHGNFLHYDFFDNFMANFGQNDCDAKNDETFHATKPTSEYAFVTEEIEIKRYSDVDGSGTYDSDGDEIPQLVERTMKAKHYASDEWDHNNGMHEYNSDSDDSDDDDIPPPLVSRHGVVHGHDEVSLIGRHDNISDDDSIYDEIPHLIARQQHDSDDDDSDDDDSDDDDSDDDDDDDDLIHTDDEPYYYDGDGDDESTVQTETSIQDEINSTLNGIAMANMDKWKSEEMKLTPQTWFGDSAASTHMCNDDTNLYDYDVIREEIKVGSGKTIVATKIGKLKLRVKQTNGKVLMMVLTKVKFVPELWCNLFSLTAAMDKGFDLGNQGRIITVTHGSTTIGFDRIFPTSSGFIMAAEMEQMTAEGAYAVLEAGREISIAKFHEMYGHPGEAILRNTAHAYNLKLQSKLEKCENCALAKSRQANISKEPVDRSEVPGEELMIDISSVKKTSAGGNKFWLQVMDNASDFIFSMFLKKKSETSAKMIALVKDLNAKGFKVKKIRCDRAGENMKFQDEAKNEGLGLTFEFTAPNTPQRNGRVERKFATAFGRVRAMMNTARMTETMRGNLWAEAADTATKLDTALVYQRGEQSSHQKFWKREARFARHLRTFGEMAVIKVHTKIKGKLKDRGRTLMFVGYADNSSGDTYKFYDPKTKRISSSRDVSWLNKSYGDWKGIKKTNTLRLTQEILLETVHDNDITQAPTTHTSDANTTAPEPGPIPTATAPAGTATIPAVQLDSGANPQRVTRFGPTQQPATTAPIPRWQRDLRTWDTDRHGTQPILRTRTQTRLATANSESGRETATRFRTTEVPTEEEEEIDFTGDQSGPLFNENDVANMMMNPDLQWPDLALQVTEEMMENIVENEEAEDTNYKEPKNFQEAWNHPDKYQRDKWREAIRKEFRDMIRRGVWRKMKRRDLPYGRRCIKCKWVFKIKRNGVFRSRLVACGYSQIPGVDFTEHFAPVINDITWRILLVAMMIWKLDAWLIDVETAFLHGEFDEGEQIFMNLPVGYDLVDSSIDMSEDCIELMKTAYGTVQGARQWWKKFVSILKDIGFEGGDADPCLMHWNSEHGIVFIGLYVDDCLCIGKPEALELVEAKLKEKGLTLKTEKTLKDYLSCDVSFNEDRTKAILRQPHLLKTLEEDIGEMVRNMPKYKTPGTPGQGLVRSEEGVTVTPEEQKQFRSGTGKLLYLVKHTRPDIANAVRELSKVLDSTTPRAMKEMKRIIKHVLDTKGLGLKIEPVIGSKGLLWNVVAFSDSDYAGDPDSRKSVSGFIVYLCGVPICWRSKAQRTVTLSSAEAEWIALSEVAKEVLFIAQILETMGVKVEYPIVIRVDNTAAIFMATNVTTNQRTRHVDIRTKFVTQYTGPDGILKILFVKGTDNESDIMTKNVTGNLHEKHIPKMMTNIDEGTTK